MRSDGLSNEKRRNGRIRGTREPGTLKENFLYNEIDYLLVKKLHAKKLNIALKLGQQTRTGKFCKIECDRDSVW